MSSKDGNVPANAPGTRLIDSPIAWVSKLYPRLQLREEEIRRLQQRYLGAGILTEEDLNHELHKAQHWLADHPAKASRKRNWYKFLRNWFDIAEENKRDRQPRRRVGKTSAPTESDERGTRAAVNRQTGRPF